MALPQGALFWPAREALLVADLHLEKASWFARLGQMLPPYDSMATLSDLTALAAATGAKEIWCLGDSFHDRHGCDRLPARARELLTALTDAGVPCALVTMSYRVLADRLVAAVRVYQREISPKRPPCCSFSPTCSAYAVEALERHGAGRGTWLTLRRLVRCRPGAVGGADPVPA